MPREDLGVPFLGTRIVVALLSKKTMLWAGVSDDSNQTDQFKSLFTSHVTLEMDDFAGIDSDEMHKKWVIALAARQGIVNLENDDVEAEYCMSQSHLEIWAGYQSMMEERKGVKGTFVCDVSQRPQHSAKCGAWAPRLATSTMLLSLTQNEDPLKPHIFTMDELGFAHGFPVTPMAKDEYRQCLPFSITGLSVSQQISVMGNGMHISTMAAFYAFVLSNVVRTDMVKYCAPSDERHEEIKGMKKARKTGAMTTAGAYSWVAESSGLKQKDVKAVVDSLTALAAEHKKNGSIKLADPPSRKLACVRGRPNCTEGARRKGKCKQATATSSVRVKCRYCQKMMPRGNLARHTKKLHGAEYVGSRGVVKPRNRFSDHL